ncbi:MAG: hypothetical protein M3220_07340 [Chloroflexota bacterium]|nr:hypothetical protein [Chloroflexota bacterium]
MPDLSLHEIKELLIQEFGPSLGGPRDEGLDQMASFLSRRGVDRQEAEGALAEMVEEGLIRYQTEPIGGTGAGIIGMLDQPTGTDFPMEGAKPRRGAVPASEEHGTGHWDFLED